jgi:hypothetical protein
MCNCATKWLSKTSYFATRSSHSLAWKGILEASRRKYNTDFKTSLIMHFLFLVASVSHRNVVVAFDSLWDMTSSAADDTLTSYDTFWDAEKINIEESDIALSNNIFDWEGINVKDTNFESSHILLNPAEPSSVFLNSEAASSNIFLNSEETGYEESNVALSDTFLNVDEILMTWAEPVFDSSDELKTFWTDESFSTNAFLQASCVISTDDFPPGSSRRKIMFSGSVRVSTTTQPAAIVRRPPRSCRRFSWSRGRWWTLDSWHLRGGRYSTPNATTRSIHKTFKWGSLRVQISVSN